MFIVDGYVIKQGYKTLSATDKNIALEMAKNIGDLSKYKNKYTIYNF